jgi:hypothetical protein
MEESFHRAILPSIDWWSTRDNRLTSACFKDKKGLSTDRRGNRSAEETSYFLRRHKPTAIGEAVIPESLCLDLECRIIDSPTPDNPFHTEIHGTEKPGLTKLQSRAIASECTFLQWRDV